MTIFWSAVLF